MFHTLKYFNLSRAPDLPTDNVFFLLWSQKTNKQLWGKNFAMMVGYLLLKQLRLSGPKGALWSFSPLVIGADFNEWDPLISARGWHNTHSCFTLFHWSTGGSNSQETQQCISKDREEERKLVNMDGNNARFKILWLQLKILFANN